MALGGNDERGQVSLFACPGVPEQSQVGRPMVKAAQPGTVRAVSRLDRITIIPSVCHGKPTVRGLRYPVEDLLGWLASGMTVEEILDDYPDLEHEDILAALEFGALAAGIHDTVDLRAA